MTSNRVPRPGRGRASEPLGTLYRAFRVADGVLPGAGLVGVLLWLPDDLPGRVLAVAVWMFALVEYVNDVVVRRAYPVGRWLGAVRRWQTPRLVQDVREVAGERHPTRTSAS